MEQHHPSYLFIVNYQAGKNWKHGVFYGSDLDSALRFCLHYTGIKKFSPEPEWRLVVYKTLINDLHRRHAVCVAAFDQDGYSIPIPNLQELLEDVEGGELAAKLLTEGFGPQEEE